MARARVSQDIVEVLQGAFGEGKARVSQDVIEVLQAYTAGVAPAGSFGAAASQKVVEVLQSISDGRAYLSQDAVEVLFQDGQESGGAGGTTSYGFAV